MTLRQPRSDLTGTSRAAIGCAGPWSRDVRHAAHARLLLAPAPAKHECWMQELAASLAMPPSWCRGYLGVDARGEREKDREMTLGPTISIHRGPADERTERGGESSAKDSLCWKRKGKPLCLSSNSMLFLLDAMLVLCTVS
jgi:hypothetical protein